MGERWDSVCEALEMKRFDILNVIKSNYIWYTNHFLNETIPKCLEPSKDNEKNNKINGKTIIFEVLETMENIRIRCLKPCKNNVNWHFLNGPKEYVGCLGPCIADGKAIYIKYDLVFEAVETIRFGIRSGRNNTIWYLKR